MSVQDDGIAGGHQIPHTHRGVPRAARNPAAVRAEIHTPNRAGMAFQNQWELLGQELPFPTAAYRIGRVQLDFRLFAAVLGMELSYPPDGLDVLKFRNKLLRRRP